MKKLVALIAIMLLLTTQTIAEELITAFGYDFGMPLDVIKSDMEKYEGVRVDFEVLWTDSNKSRLLPNVLAQMPDDSSVMAFGRRVSKILFLGSDGSNSLHETKVTLDGIDTVQKYTRSDAPDQEAYDNAIVLWPKIVSEFVSSYGSSTDAAVYCGENVLIAKLTDTDTLIDSEKLSEMMPVDWYLQYDHCGVVVHIGNVMLEMKLIKEEHKLFDSRSLHLKDIITITYSDHLYGNLVAVEPTPSPTPKQSLDGLNIMG